MDAIRQAHIDEINMLTDLLKYASDGNYFEITGRLALLQDQLYWYDKIMGGE